MDSLNNNINLNSIINISIPTFGEKYIDKKTVTYYQVEITDKKSQKTWTLDKRFNDFQIFHDSLYKLISNFPSVPSKSFFKLSSSEALNKRRLELEQFLIKCAARKDIFNNQLFKDFIEIDKQAADISSNQVKLNFTYKKIVLGVRNFILVPHKGIMLMCCSDMNIVSRADSYLFNFSLFSSNNDLHFPLGAAFVYQCEDDKKGGYIIHKIWAKSFPIQTGVIAWEDNEEVYSVGNDDGKIYCFKAVPKTHYVKMNQILELNFHKNRVMGLEYDSEKKVIYSVSTDKTFYKTSIEEGNINPILICNSESGYTNLIHDKKNERFFLTNEGGELQIFVTIDNQIIEIKRIKTSAQTCIRAINIEYTKNYIFTGSVDGKICIMNLSLPGKEKLISEISTFGANMKIRIIKYNSLGHELIAGDEDGRVTIWKLKTGKPIYVWEAHPKSAITQMEWDQKNLILWTGSKDKTIKVWQLPEKWLDDDVEDFEQKEIKNYTEKIAKMKINTKEQDSDDSDNDDLKGWDYDRRTDNIKLDNDMKNI